ncbi:MAG: ABC transporter permease [Defluviitaleaceae bacterium]|nr:ABC transporter permease [Defluviitaleaceae bacterium]
MLIYIIRRILQAIPVMIGVSLAVFMMMHLIPGDPARIMAGEAASPYQIEQMRQNLGLNDPLPVQYWNFITRAIRGDLGNSVRSGVPVVQEIFEARFFITFQLALVGLSAAMLIGLVIGLISAVYRYSLTDMFLMILALLGLSIPNFWLGLILINLFSVRLDLLPITGWGTWQQMIMPMIVLGISGAAVIARMTRASLVDVFTQDYIRTAYAKGVSDRVVLYRHALRNALIPVVTVVGLQFGGLLAGAAITETIFAINGMGRLMIQAINTRDFPVAQGAILIISLVFVLVNMLVDISYRLINRRIDFD